MKNLFLLIAFVFATALSYGQSVPEKSNTIVVTLADSNKVSDKVVKALSGRDYTPTVNKNSTVTTAPKTLKNGARVGYTAQIKGNEVALTGKILVAGQSNMMIEYKGKKDSPIMNGWEEMEKIAKALGGKVSYATR